MYDINEWNGSPCLTSVCWQCTVNMQKNKNKKKIKKKIK